MKFSQLLKSAVCACSFVFAAPFALGSEEVDPPYQEDPRLIIAYNDNGWTNMEQAILDRDAHEVERMFACCADFYVDDLDIPNFKNRSTGSTPLTLVLTDSEAAPVSPFRDRLRDDIIDALLDAGAEPDRPNGLGITPHRMAYNLGDNVILKKFEVNLKKNGRDVNWEDITRRLDSFRF